MGYPAYDPANVRASAEATRDILAEAGVPRTSASSSWTAAIPRSSASSPDPSGAPTVLLYAHHDVQPEGPLDEWDTPPFEPVVKDGRMYGRGAADDKSGIVVHAAAIRALLADGDPPVTIKVVVEGEEECSTEHLPQLVQGNADLLKRRRRRDRRRRELPHRRPHAEHLDPWRDGHRRAGPGPPSSAALRLVRRADPRRHHRALAHDRVAPRRRRERRHRGTAALRVDRDADPGGRVPGGVGRPRPGRADRVGHDLRSRDDRPRGRRPRRSTPPRSPARRIRSCRSRARG